MSTIGNSVGLATAFVAGIAIAANAGPLSRAGAGASAPVANPPSSSTPLGSGQPPGRELGALPPPMRRQRQTAWHCRTLPFSDSELPRGLIQGAVSAPVSALLGR
jgi:hypothetical protein